MAFFKRHPPDVLYRGAIILGCFAFLLGVAGIFYFRQEGDPSVPDADVATIWVHGVVGGEGAGAEASELEDLEIVVRWNESVEGKSRPATRIETGRRGEAPGLFTFRRAPEGRPVQLTIYRSASERPGASEGPEPTPPSVREPVHSQIVILTYGQRTYAAVPLGPARAPERK